MRVGASRRMLLSLLMLVALAPDVSAQPASSPRSGELFNTIEALDRAVFDAYNACDLPKLGVFFSEDVEFYHDKGGVSTSRQQVVDSIKQFVCGRVRRELVASSLEVYAVPGYGAIEVGTHRFFNRESGTEQGGDPVKFLSLWQNTNGQWMMTRVFSYAH